MFHALVPTQKGATVHVRPGCRSQEPGAFAGSHVGLGVQGLNPFTTTFPGALASGLEETGLEPAPMWDAGVSGGGLMCCATTLALIF